MQQSCHLLLLLSKDSTGCVLTVNCCYTQDRLGVIENLQWWHHGVMWAKSDYNFRWNERQRTRRRRRERMRATVLLVILPLLRDGLAADRAREEICDGELREKYCEAWYGGDYHTACRFCGRGRNCPDGNISGRKIEDTEIRWEEYYK